MKEEQSVRKVILVGNPNVGKSLIFRLLTGNYVLVSNFPGTTVEISRGRMELAGKAYEIVDTPGVGSLVPQSEDEYVTCEILLRERPDQIVQIADAKNLRRTLLVTSQLVEFGLPLILVLNMMDEAEERGIAVDSKGLSELFGLPVVETVAIYSRGRKQLQQALLNVHPPRSPLELPDGSAVPGEAGRRPVPAGLAQEWLALEGRGLEAHLEAAFGRSVVERLKAAATAYHKGRNRLLSREIGARRNHLVEEAVERLRTKRVSRFVQEGGKWSARVWLAALLCGLALFAWSQLGAILHFTTPFSATLAWLQKAAPAGSRNLFQSLLFGQASGGHFDYGLLPEAIHFAIFIAPIVFPLAFLLGRNRSFTHELGILTRRASTGIPILIVVLLLMYEFVGYTGAQTLVGLLEDALFGKHLIPALASIFPPGFAADLLLGKYGLISMGLTYAIAIVLPVVATFFIAFSLLEDSGYLPRLSILSDRLMRHMGLNGKAILPMVLGLGCVTMATMTTRILQSRKERLIATLLLALGIPCSAQLGVVLGLTAGFSLAATMTVVGVVVSQLFLVGFLAARVLPGRPSEFIFEIPPIRVPQMKNVLMKTALRIRWYLQEAVPLFLIGTLVLFLLDKLQAQGRSLLEWLQVGLEPLLSGILHLPASTAGVFVLGFLRRDYGAAGLFSMVRDGLLTPQQTVVCLIVITLFVPCLASLLVMVKEQGLRRALAIAGFIIPFAFTVGAVVSWILRILNVKFA